MSDQDHDVQEYKQFIVQTQERVADRLIKQGKDKQETPETKEEHK